MVKSTTAAQSRAEIVKAAESALQLHRKEAGHALRTIFLNLFRHNSARLSSAKYESRWRFVIIICWRDGESLPCPAAAGRERIGRNGHQAEIEFSISVVEPSLVVRMRVDDSVLNESFPNVLLVRGYAKELRVFLEAQFGLTYPKFQDVPIG